MNTPHFSSAHVFTQEAIRRRRMLAAAVLKNPPKYDARGIIVSEALRQDLNEIQMRLWSCIDEHQVSIFATSAIPERRCHVSFLVDCISDDIGSKEALMHALNALLITFAEIK